MESQYDGIPLTLILDCKVQRRTLTMAGMEAAHLMEILKGQGIERAKDVLVALLDTQGKLLVQEKGEEGRLLNIPVMKASEVKW